MTGSLRFWLGGRSVRKAEGACLGGGGGAGRVRSLGPAPGVQLGRYQ